MNWFPQMGSGSIAQFPVSRAREWRSIVNVMESGEQISLPDTSGGLIQWRLSYQELTGQEAANLNSLFQASQGQFAPFIFLDPLANLLGWSESLAQPGWQCGVLTVSAGVNDPLGTQRASSITNGAGGNQSLSQSLSLAGSVVTCFSVWLRSDSATAVSLARDGAQIIAAVTPVWTRVYVSGRGTSGAEASTFSLEIPPGQTVDVWGLQVEAQPYPSKYKATGAANGIYEETYFASDQLTLTDTAPGLSACDIQLISRV